MPLPAGTVGRSPVEAKSKALTAAYPCTGLRSGLGFDQPAVYPSIGGAPGPSPFAEAMGPVTNVPKEAQTKLPPVKPIFEQPKDLGSVVHQVLPTQANVD